MYIYRKWSTFSVLLLLAATGWILLTTLYMNDALVGIPAAPHQGFFAPDFELESVDGEIYRLHQLRGQPVIINLWASWCPPCKAEMPALQRVYESYRSSGLIILGVNMTFQDSLPAAVELVNQEGLTFPILLDHDGATARLYRMSALPTTVFIDAEGIVQGVIVGGPLSEAFLMAQVAGLVKEEQ